MKELLNKPIKINWKVAIKLFLVSALVSTYIGLSTYADAKIDDAAQERASHSSIWKDNSKKVGESCSVSSQCVGLSVCYSGGVDKPAICHP